MPIELSTLAIEGSTFVLAAQLHDQDNVAITPKTFAWTLTDDAGTVINSRDGETVANPGSTVYVVLTGLDLAMLGTNVRKLGNRDVEYRKVTIEATYDSTIGGVQYSDLPLTDEVRFAVTALAGI